jgi:16S rRNA (uracil1498-N3)-methyltransferase
VRLRRVYLDAPLAPGARVTLAGNAASHVTRVLRLRVGEDLTLFNGRGGEYAGAIAAAHAGEVTVTVGEHRPIERESPLALTLAQGVSRGERMDLVVQKATELGAVRLAPLLTERSVVRLDARQAERKRNHWHAIAVGACEQSGRNRVPEVLAPLALREFLRAAPATAAAAAPAGAPAAPPAAGPQTAPLRLLLSPAGERPIAALQGPLRTVTVLIGPEGGLEEAEQAAAVAAGFVPVRLGPRILRTETAAIAAIALLQRQFGDLG